MKRYQQGHGSINLMTVLIVIAGALMAGVTLLNLGTMLTMLATGKPVPGWLYLMIMGAATIALACWLYLRP